MGSVRLGMDSLVPVKGSLGIGRKLRRSSVIKDTRLPFPRGNTVIAENIDKGRINIFTAAVDDDGIFWNRDTGAGADDDAIPDKKRGARYGGLPILHERGIGKSITFSLGSTTPLTGKVDWAEAIRTVVSNAVRRRKVLPRGRCR